MGGFVGNSLLRRNILDNLDMIKIVGSNSAITYNNGVDILTLKIKNNFPSKELVPTEYNFFINDNLILSKQVDSKNINTKEEYYILGGCLCNDLNSLLFKKDKYIYTNDKVLSDKFNYELNDNLFIAISNLPLKIYYNSNKQEKGIMINDKKYIIDINRNIEKQIEDIINNYFKSIDKLEIRIKKILTYYNINNEKIDNCYKDVEKVINKNLKFKLTKKQIQMIIDEINNIKNVYDRFIKYNSDTEDILIEVFKINTMLEQLMNANEEIFNCKQWYNKTYKI